MHLLGSLVTMILALTADGGSASAERVSFVEGGKPLLVHTANPDWHEADGAYACVGRETGAHLYAARMVGHGDFRVYARLSLAKVSHTAASFVIDDRSHFGFDGLNRMMFVQGPFFGGKTIHLETSAGLIEAERPFDFEMIRTGDEVRFLVDGKEVHRVSEAGKDIGRLGFRPWRNTMRIVEFVLEAAPGVLLPLPSQPRGYTIPTLDVAHETWRQAIVESIPGQYLGHPTTVLMPDNRTIYVTYPLGHGRPAAVLKRSDDGGLTWTERLPVPENWATATNCPCIHLLTDPRGVQRLFVFEGVGDMRQAVSEDGGRTWTPFEPNGLKCVVAPITIVPIAGDRLLMHVHRGAADGDRSPLTIWQSVSDDGGLTWGPQRLVAEHSGADLCEPAVFRSPDGSQLASIMRENRRRYNSFVMFSDDEGETWTDPVEVPASLTGDRHMPRYAHDGRLVMTFRDTAFDSPTRGDFVAWVGTYDDVASLREGQYRVRLLDATKKFDLGYPGLELLPDGTFVTTTYAELVAGELNSVVSVRFKLDELDRKAAYDMEQTDVFVSGQDGYHTFRIPVALVTRQGTVLAFCEGRRNSGADHGDIDLLLRRSADGGKTWGPIETVWDDGEHTIGNPCPVQDRETGAIWLAFCRNNDQVFITRSDDDGRNWAPPREITADVKRDGWTWYATGPVHGIQLKSGRLLLPCDHRPGEGAKQHSHVVYSDDHGATWRLGGVLEENTDECVALERENGDVYMNMRSYHGRKRRVVATSNDGGLTWPPVRFDETLVEPVCQASVCRLSYAADGGKSRILFSNPASVDRVKMTVRVSYDEGETWAAGQVVQWGPSAYSDLCVTPDGAVGLLYERGEKNPYERITFARLDLDWLTGGADD